MGFATRSTHPTRYALQFGRWAGRRVGALAFPNREHRIEIRGAQTRAGLMRLRLDRGQHRAVRYRLWASMKERRTAFMRLKWRRP